MKKGLLVERVRLRGEALLLWSVSSVLVDSLVSVRHLVELNLLFPNYRQKIHSKIYRLSAHFEYRI